MSFMKERYMDAVDYAEDCCGMFASYDEALTMFSMLYPDAENILQDAWYRWVAFRDYMFNRGGNDDNALEMEF